MWAWYGCMLRTTTTLISLQCDQRSATLRAIEVIAMSRAVASGEEERCRYKGVRRRRWGKWVSEIRVPGTRERLWLGSYATPQAAAVAHDTAVYFLRGGPGVGVGDVGGGGGAGALNFPERAAAVYGAGAGVGAGAPLSPRSVQRVASDAGMAADAQLVAARESAPPRLQERRADRAAAGIVASRGGGADSRHEEYVHDAYDVYTFMGGDTTTSSGGGGQQFAPGEISVDDMEIMM